MTGCCNFKDIRNQISAWKVLRNRAQKRMAFKRGKEKDGESHEPPWEGGGRLALQPTKKHRTLGILGRATICGEEQSFNSQYIGSRIKKDKPKI